MASAVVIRSVKTASGVGYAGHTSCLLVARPEGGIATTDSLIKTGHEEEEHPYECYCHTVHSTQHNTLLVFIGPSTFRLLVRLRVVIERAPKRRSHSLCDPRHFRTNFTLAVHCCSLPRRRVTNSSAITFDRNGNQTYSPSAALHLKVWLHASREPTRGV
jgi:hypothetical protein